MRGDVEKLIGHRANCAWPELYYSKVSALIDLVKPPVVVEVGVAYGFHADYILQRHPDLTYVGIDPFVPGYDDSDPFVRDVAALFSASPEEGMDRLHDAVSSFLGDSHLGRFRLVRDTSVNAAAEFGEGEVEFVFIDGDHSFDAVTADLESWWPKVKSGGILVGDDYQWVGVKTAATLYFSTGNTEVFTLGQSKDAHLSFFVMK